MDRLREEIRALLLPKDPNDQRSVILEVRSGVGGEEGALFAAAILRMYTMYAQRRGWRTEMLNLNETELGGIKECSVLIEGEGVWSRLKFESGVHRVQRVPVTESSGRIQTSAATVAVLPEAEEVDVAIDPKDLQIDTYRSSGAGGTAREQDRVRHPQSPICPQALWWSVRMSGASTRTRTRPCGCCVPGCMTWSGSGRRPPTAAERRSQVGSGDRSERIRTYNFPQGRVTDHRIGLTLYKIDAVMDGDLDELVDALVTADQAEKLKAGETG